VKKYGPYSKYNPVALGDMVIDIFTQKSFEYLYSPTYKL